MSNRTIETTVYMAGVMVSETTEQHWLAGEYVDVKQKTVMLDAAWLWSWVESNIAPRLEAAIRAKILDDVKQLAPAHADAIATVLAAKETEAALTTEPR